MLSTAVHQHVLRLRLADAFSQTSEEGSPIVVIAAWGSALDRDKGRILRNSGKAEREGFFSTPVQARNHREASLLPIPPTPARTVDVKELYS
jgi:hypothetical protein